MARTNKYLTKDKATSRKKSIITPFRKHMRKRKVPKDKAFLSLCAAQHKHPYSELQQVVNENLIEFNQYYGIDNSKKNINCNKKIFPEANWFHGDYTDILGNLLYSERITPGVIHIDSVWMAKKATDLFDYTLSCINDLGIEKVLIILNLVKKSSSSGRIDSDEFIKDAICSSRYYINSNFKCISDSEYIGSNRTIMRPLVFCN